MILIHGRSTKPSASAHKKLIRAALLNGLRRVDNEAAEKIASGEINLEFAYYGDLNNWLMLEDDPNIYFDLTANNDERYGLAPCLAAGPLARGIDRLKAVEAHDRPTYKRFLAAYKDYRWIDEVADVVSAAAAATGLSERVIKWATADMSQYLLTRQVGSEVRQRLQTHLKPALENKQDICLVSHSMGCIVSYDVMWKYSRMSEYRGLQQPDAQVSLWLTLGCPLGEPGVRENLYDASERGGDRFPRHIIRNWVNMAAEDDFVAHDGTMENDFREMVQLEYLESIRDSSIYNFWTSDGKLNPHNFYGYLDNSHVAREIAGWIKDEHEAGARDSETPVTERMAIA